MKQDFVASFNITKGAHIPAYSVIELLLGRAAYSFREIESESGKKFGLVYLSKLQGFR